MDINDGSRTLNVDMKSFYASVSAVTMGLNPMTCYLAVVGNSERQGSVSCISCT